MRRQRRRVRPDQPVTPTGAPAQGPDPGNEPLAQQASTEVRARQHHPLTRDRSLQASQVTASTIPSSSESNGCRASASRSSPHASALSRRGLATGKPLRGRSPRTRNPAAPARRTKFPAPHPRGPLGPAVGTGRRPGSVTRRPVRWSSPWKRAATRTTTQRRARGTRSTRSGSGCWRGTRRRCEVAGGVGNAAALGYLHGGIPARREGRSEVEQRSW